jgi:L-asparaginase/Glu-tRNA(Gln) amidotransferase subunit D
LKTWQNPLFFTGSQLPMICTDAKENLITAIQIASLQKMGCRYY